MVDEPDYASLSVEELRSMADKIGRALQTADQRRRADALAACEATAREWGFTLTELISQPRSSPAMAKLAELASTSRPPASWTRGPPKYRDPRNAENVWTGRGRAPGWFKEAIKAGTTAEDMEIPPP